MPPPHPVLVPLLAHAVMHLGQAVFPVDAHPLAALSGRTSGATRTRAVMTPSRADRSGDDVPRGDIIVAR